MRKSTTTEGDQDKIVFRAMVWHTNPKVNEAKRKVGHEGSIRQLRLGMDGATKIDFDEHLMLCDEVESVIKYLAQLNLPFTIGTVVSVRNKAQQFKIDRIEYHHLSDKKAILCEVYLNPHY